MKVWIDKQGGTHYHKEGCPVTIPMQNGVLLAIPMHYEPIERRLRGNNLMGYRDIIVDGKRYSPCPICFGDGERK